MTIGIWDSIFLRQQGSMFFQKRAAMLDHCIMAHTRKMYALTIPALLPVIENIVLRILGLPENKGALAQKLQKSKHRKPFCSFVSKADFLNGILFEQSVLEVFQITKANANVFLRRNATLHGYDKQYATEMSSLFLFFVDSQLRGASTSTALPHSAE